MVTTLPSHGAKIGTSTVQTLNGGHAMDPHAESGTPVSGGQSTSSSDDASASVPVVNNGPGVAKGHANVTVAPSPNTVIQSSYASPPCAAPAAASSAGPSAVRPSMQTAGTGLTINGSNNNAVSVTVANVATQPAPGITLTTTSTTTTATPLLMNQTPASVSASPNKSESPKTVSPAGMTLGPQIQSPVVATGAVLQGVARAAAPVTVASSPAIRAIAPQVLAPRLPQSSPGQGIQNIQLPPGTPLSSMLLTLCAVTHALYV